MELLLLVLHFTCLSYVQAELAVAKYRQISFKRLRTCGLHSRILNVSSVLNTTRRMDCIEACSWNFKCLAVSSCNVGENSVKCYQHDNFIVINKCQYHIEQIECSAWMKVVPCENNGLWNWDSQKCGCLPGYKGDKCQVYAPSSCKDKYDYAIAMEQTPSSGKFVTYTPNMKSIEVFCDFKKSSGVTFISRKSLVSMTSEDLQRYIPDPSRFIMRHAYNDGKQIEATFTLPSMYPGNWYISIGINTTISRPPANKQLKPFIYITGLPYSEMYKGRHIGYRAEATDFTYYLCDASFQNYFAFYSNPNKEKLPNCKGIGIAYHWVNVSHAVPSSQNLPPDFLYVGETYFSGCGAFISSNNFKDSIGASPGFTFDI